MSRKSVCRYCPSEGELGGDWKKGGQSEKNEENIGEGGLRGGIESPCRKMVIGGETLGGIFQKGKTREASDGRGLNI